MSIFTKMGFGQQSPKNTKNKSGLAGSFFALNPLGIGGWPRQDYHSLIGDGFSKNAVVYRCIRLISEAAASVPITLYDGDKELESHPLLDLLRSPNPEQSFAVFMDGFYAYLNLSGNSYIELVEQDGRPQALYLLRPDRIKITPDKQGWPNCYRYKTDTSERIYHLNMGDVPPVFHHKLFHPCDDYYGLSPLMAAGLSVDIHNAANFWNKALFDNAARPSGALVYKGPEGAPNLTEEQFDRLKGELENNYRGAANAGRPLLLEGGLEWTALSLTPQDMDFINAKHTAARDIALAFGVPPMLLGIPGDNSYANYAEANRAFWRQTILPLVERSTQSLGLWLCRAFAPSQNLQLKCNLNAIPALADERGKLWQRIGRADFLTPNEKRKALGYSPLPEGDNLPPAFTNGKAKS